MSEEYGNIDEYKKTKNGTSLAKLGETPFVIVKVDRSDYDETVGVGFHTEEKHTIDGEKQNYFYTTREVIVKRFFNLENKKVIGETELFQAINNGKKFKVSCKLITGKPGKNNYFDLVSASQMTQEKF